MNFFYLHLSNFPLKSIGPVQIILYTGHVQTHFYPICTGHVQILLTVTALWSCRDSNHLYIGHVQVLLTYTVTMYRFYLPVPWSCTGCTYCNCTMAICRFYLTVRWSCKNSSCLYNGHVSILLTYTVARYRFYLILIPVK